MRDEVRRSLPLLVLFVAGLGAGIWIFAAPWVLGYAAPGGWTTSTWTSVGVGGVLTVASAVSLVTLLARSVHVAIRTGPDGR